MKIIFIFVLYNTPKEEVLRLKKEVADIKLSDYSIAFIDNSNRNKGYAQGVNEGIKKTLPDNPDIYIIANPDISLKGLTPLNLLRAKKYFDIWGFSFKQNDKIYYGGKVDKWRMSGGLIDQKSTEHYKSVDFISGSLMVIKKEVINKISFLDERYFMYYEDVDYCIQAKNAGFKIGIDSKTYYTHFETSKTNKEKNIYLEKNRIKFLLKFGSTSQKMHELIRIPKTIYENKLILLQILQKNSFYTSFFSLNATSIIIKLLNLILFIFLIKYFSISEYGIYTLVWTQIGLLSPFLDLGTTTYGLIHISHNDKNHFFSLLSFRLTIAIVIFIITILLAFIFHYPPLVIGYIIFTSFVIFSNMWSGSYLILTSVREKIYLASLISLIFNTILTFGLILSLVFFKNLSVIFILVFVFYNLYTILNLYLIKADLGKIKLIFDYKIWLSIIKKSYIFVLISFFAGLYFKLDILLLKLLKSEVEVGIYSAGFKFFEAFIFIAASYNLTATPIFARLVNTNRNAFFAKIKKDIILLGAIGIFTSVTIYFSAPLLLSFILKGDYIKATSVLQIVIFALPLILISSIFFNSLYVLNKAKWVVYLFIFQTIFNLTLNFLFIPVYSYYASAYITIIGELINLIILIILFKYITRKENNKTIPLL